MADHSTYSADKVAATLDGRRITGLFEGDNAIEVAPLAARGEMKIGAQGDSIFSGSTNKGARITIRLMHTSPIHRALVKKDKQARSGNLSSFPFSVKDTGSGEGGTASACHIEQAPTMQTGLNATAREWVLVTGEWTESVPFEAE